MQKTKSVSAYADKKEFYKVARQSKFRKGDKSLPKNENRLSAIYL